MKSAHRKLPNQRDELLHCRFVGLREYHRILEENKNKLSDGASAAVERVTRVGKAVAAASRLGTKCHWEFHVLDSPDANAFVLPGGKVFVHQGLLDMFESDEELSIIIGHEVGHVQVCESSTVRQSSL